MAKQFLAALILIAFACLILCFTTSTESRAVANEEIQVSINSEPVTPSTHTLAPPPPGLTVTLSGQERNSVAIKDALVIAKPNATHSDRQLVNEGPTGTTWCIAKPSTDEGRLQGNIDYSCAHVNCSIIKPGGSCHEPNNVVSQASVVMNLYYKTWGKHVGTCDFTSSGLIIIQDPSVGKCKYDAS